jgi:hypothetical protein
MFGRPLHHAQATSHYIRLFRPEAVRYERLVNPVTVVDGPVGDLAGDLDHHPMSHGVGQWMRKHVGYAALEASQVLVESADDGGRPTLGQLRTVGWKPLAKRLYARLPGRPLIRFAYIYVGRRGYRDGRAGFRVAILQAWYEYTISLHRAELTGGYEIGASSTPKPLT